MILKLRQRLHKKSALGFTLTELAIVLGIMGLISGAIWYAASNTHEAQYDAAAVTELQTIATNITTLYQGQTALPPIPAACTGLSAILGVQGACAMVLAKTIPNIYVDGQNNLLVDNPWNQSISTSLSGVEIYEAVNGLNSFRLSFYNVSYKGCLSLLLQGTACHAGQIGCPVRVFTAYNSSCAPAGCATNVNGAVSDWPMIMTPAYAQTMCSHNVYPGSDVEFEYKF